jgi:hypothetical protein
VGEGVNKIFWAREVSRGEEMRDMKEKDTGGDALRIGDLVRGGVIERGEEVKGDAQSFRAEVVSCGETFLGFERARNAAIAARFCAIFGIATGGFVLGDVGGLSLLGVRATGFDASGGDGSREFKNTESGKNLDSFRL